MCEVQNKFSSQIQGRNKDLITLINFMPAKCVPETNQFTFFQQSHLSAARYFCVCLIGLDLDFMDRIMSFDFTWGSQLAWPCVINTLWNITIMPPFNEPLRRLMLKDVINLLVAS